MMKKYLINSIYIFRFIALLFLATACMVKNQENTLVDVEASLKPGKPISSGYEEDYSFNPFLNYVYSETSNADLRQIKERGKLIALTGYSATGYFVYKGTPMGFEHDLLQLLAKELKVDLEIIIVNNMDEIIDMLNRGEGDLIADNLTITKERDALVNFTEP
jgi:ABC-type amino acid transport substrate-binding protein